MNESNDPTQQREMQKSCREIKMAKECLLVPVVNALELTVEG